MPNKRKRHSKPNLMLAIQELLQNEAVKTQEDIRKSLHGQNIHVNQVRISRVLHQLGAVKINEGERTVYRLANELAPVTPSNSLKALILNITHNETLIVILTTPGSAQLIARLLDQKKELKILGTVAGDDTIIIIPQSIKQIKNTFQQIQQHLLG